MSRPGAPEGEPSAIATAMSVALKRVKRAEAEKLARYARLLEEHIEGETSEERKARLDAAREQLFGPDAERSHRQLELGEPEPGPEQG